MRNTTHCTSLLRSLNMQTINDTLPGIGDDSNRLIEVILNRLLDEGTLESAHITFFMKMEANHIILSEDADPYLLITVYLV